MVQKTVRFYEESPDDAKALEILNNYRKYGYNNCREMIIASIIAYSQKGQNSSGEIDVEELAERIVNKINLNITTISPASGSEIKEDEYESSNNEENYNKALSFMESL